MLDWKYPLTSKDTASSQISLLTPSIRSTPDLKDEPTKVIHYKPKRLTEFLLMIAFSTHRDTQVVKFSLLQANATTHLKLSHLRPLSSIIP